VTLIIDVSCRGVDETRRLKLEDGEELLVGRDSSELVLRKDQTLSRRHFVLRYSNGSITIEHLSRTNPTLMAAEGSGEFQRIRETQTESRTCRIIAGSHRFVATLESYESATISGDISEIWSDFEEPGEVDLEQSEVKLPVPEPINDHLGQPEKPVFTWDDSVDEHTEAPTIIDAEVKPKPRKPEEAMPKGPIPSPVEDAAPPAPAPKPQKRPAERTIEIEEQESFPDDFFD